MKQGRFFALFFLILELYWVLSQTLWLKKEELISSNGAANDFFGFSVSIYANYAIIGVPFKTIGSNSNQGAAYIYFNETQLTTSFQTTQAQVTSFQTTQEQTTSQQTTFQQTTHQQSISFTSKLVFKKWLLIFLFLISF